MVKIICALICFCMLHIRVDAQDKIYYKQNKTDAWKVTEVSPEFIKGTDLKDPQIAYSTTLKNVLFIFNDLGNFLVVPKLFEKSVPDAYIKSFFKKIDNRFNQFDKIITVNNNIIICKFEKDLGKKVEYSVAGKSQQVQKSDIAVIVFKNGEHQLVASTEKVFKTLSDIQDQYLELAVSTEKPQGIDSVKTLKDKLLAEDEPAKRSDSVKSNAIPVVSKEVAKNIPASEKKLDFATLIKLQDKAIQNIKMLESYIKLICRKTTEPDEVDRVIDQAIVLFVSEDARIEVSSVSRTDAQSFRIKVYLNRLSELKYDKVDIEWYNVQYTSQLRKGTDGNYYGIIEFEQRFTGMSNDRKVYQDITRKTVEVVLKKYKRTVDGETTMEWDVFLGNIGITETKPA